MRVLILILSSFNDPYQTLYEVNKRTWAKKQFDDVDIKFFFGSKPDMTRIDTDDDINVNCDDYDLSKKVIEAFKYCLKYDFDYIFRVCSGSYIVQSEMLKFLEDKPRIKFYCGIEGIHEGLHFASGAGFFISKDLVQIIVDRETEYLTYAHVLDDVAVGKLLLENGITIAKGALRSDDLTMIPNCWHYHPKTNIAWHYKIHQQVTGEILS